MRSMSSPRSASPETPATDYDSLTHSPVVTPAAETPASASTPLCDAPAAAMDPSTPAPTPVSVSHAPALEVENSTLKSRVAELSNLLQCALDHSIESDTRLLQFTDQIFVPNMSGSRPGVAECGVQCDLPVTCRDRRNDEDQVLVQQLRTTIDVLQAELQCLRGALEECRCGSTRDDTSSWTVVQNKKPPAVPVQNRFKSLKTGTELQVNPNSVPVTNNYKKKTKTAKFNNTVANVVHARPNTSVPSQKQSVVRLPAQPPLHLSFTSIEIESDSHGRHLAGLVKDLVSPETEVTGSCKPGAKMLNVASRSPPPPGSCKVLIAGTNDVADGQHHTIYRHLEKLINTWLSAADTTVVVATLPLRHDLPYHHRINEETVLVNSFIVNLCKRRGVEVLDINRIGRRWFTRHGMHLRLRGKRLLARLLTECLVRSDGAAVAACTAPAPPDVPRLPVPVRETPTPSTRSSAPIALVCKTPRTPNLEPVTLPYDTFADAVILGPSPGTSATTCRQSTAPVKPFLKKIFKIVDVM